MRAWCVATTATRWNVRAFEVDEALNGVEALEKLLAEPADLLIVDINMPQMDGFTFLRALRRQDAADRLHSGPGHQHRGGAAGHRGGARGRRQLLSRQAGRARTRSSSKSRIMCGLPA